MLTILCYVDRRGGFVDNLYVEGRVCYVDWRGGFVDNLVLCRPEGRVCSQSYTTLTGWDGLLTIMY